VFIRGTFSKKSSVVNGRRPFRKDFSIMNYEYDSEAEWEEEDPDGMHNCSNDICTIYTNSSCVVI
jgi:hypothetical protein